jgi:hypothetical protein
MSIRWENGGGKLLSSGLDAVFFPDFPAVLAVTGIITGINCKKPLD